uniref:AP2/ERF domain-containing protein n=1 Tax=Triticum urartu TaxID=4572 RepID=A0A8R7QEM9_TRIUA
MCPIKREMSGESGSPSPCSGENFCSPSASPERQQARQAGWTSAPAKRPAGRTKFRETRHPVYRGVRRRGNAGRWVCEVRVPAGAGAGSGSAPSTPPRPPRAPTTPPCSCSPPEAPPASTSPTRPSCSPCRWPPPTAAWTRSATPSWRPWRTCCGARRSPRRTRSRAPRPRPPPSPTTSRPLRRCPRRTRRSSRTC